jgi:hypothetical protein
VYYLETIPDERCVANVSVGNDRSEVDDNDDNDDNDDVTDQISV